MAAFLGRCAIRLRYRYLAEREFFGHSRPSFVGKVFKDLAILFRSWLKGQMFFGFVKGPQKRPILFQFRGESLVEGGGCSNAKHQPGMVRACIYLESVWYEPP